MTKKQVIFEMNGIDFVEWLNKNRLYIAYIEAILSSESVE